MASAKTEGKYLVTKIGFGRSFDMSLETNLKLLVTFGMSLEGVCQEGYTKYH